MNMKQNNRSYDELVQLHQSGKIGWLDFVLMGDDADEYRQWCLDHDEEPTEDNAELYVEMCDNRMSENLNRESDGIQ